VRIVVQRVSEAAVTVDGSVVGEIGRGLLLLVGVADGDTMADAAAAAAKFAGLRIFPDAEGRMNLAVGEAGGAVLVVSQFTLLADIRKGRRPSFVGAADPDEAEPLVAAVAAGLEDHGLEVAHGSFGASMAVSLVNDGPVTIVVDVQDGRVS
jgi:D-tyrosyl-tRNA(Tyr) deacylase